MGCMRGCNNICKTLPSGLDQHKEDVFLKHVYCRHCRKYFYKECVIASKSGAKILCPCCHTFVRRKASCSSLNRKRKRKEAKLAQLSR